MIFEKTRLKLTTWYLFIIMLISIFFSVIIYRSISFELERGYQRAAIEQKAQELNIKLPKQLPRRLEKLDPNLKNIILKELITEDIRAAKKRVQINLLILNGIILAISSIAGYILAGKTLEPIEKAMEEQKRFVTDASHELRTPLTALKTNMEVNLRDKKLGKITKQILKSNLDDINALEKLTNNLLQLANHSETKSLIFSKLNLLKIINKALKNIKPMAKKKNIKLKVNVSKNLNVYGDKTSLTELITIFLDNAVKYTKKNGQVKLSAKKNKKSVVIKIADNGFGISKKDLPYIFKRFYRADSSRSKVKTKGFGLGLSVAKKIIKQHKGSVLVQSQLKKGTTFIIKLPA